MRSLTIRRVVQTAIIGAVVALALAAALPLVASTQIVRDRIAQELSAWTGYRVRLAAAPEIRIWPSFGARLAGISFSEPGPDGATILSADRMELDLSAMAAIRGLVVFRDVDLIRPVFRVLSEDGRPVLPDPPAGGQFARATDAARRIIAETPTQLDVAKLPAISFGTVTFTDGRIVVAEDDRLRDLATSITGRLDWPQLGSGGRLDASGIWNGESVKGYVNSSQLLFLLAGGDAPVEVRAESAIANALFNGNIALGRSIFFNGYATLTTPAFGRTLEWLRLRAPQGQQIGEVQLAGTVVGDLSRLKLENVELTVEGNSGTGVLELALAQLPRRIAGTLAFQRLDLRAVLAAFAPLAAGLQAPERPIDMGLTERLGVDLRLSASQAIAGPLTLGGLAAAAQISPGFAAFDISDATLFGGSMQASIRLDRKEGRNQAEMRLNARDIDTAALSQAAGVTRLLPIGRAEFSAMIKGGGDTWQSIMASADGTLASRFGQGTIPGLDIAALTQRASEGGFFPLSDVAKGSTAIASAETKAKVTNGAIQIEMAQVRLPDNRALALRGLIPWMGQGLALSGEFRPAETTPTADAAPAPSRPGFFIGGSWLSPYVWPINIGPSDGG